MPHTYRYLTFAIIFLSTLACGLITHPVLGQPNSTSTSLLIPTETEASATPVPTGGTTLPVTPSLNSVSGPTIPPELTSTPGIALTYANAIVYQTEMVGTAFAQLGPSAHLSGFLIFYSNPVGSPLQTWHDVPIMSQATSGQEFRSDIYSYKATATLDQGIKFYDGESTKLNWSCTLATGYGGTGDNAYHSSTFMCKGFTLIVTSFDRDTKQILVVINKTPN
jgi:hypothetical protein